MHFLYLSFVHLCRCTSKIVEDNSKRRLTSLVLHALPAVDVCVRLFVMVVQCRVWENDKYDKSPSGNKFIQIRWLEVPSLQRGNILPPINHFFFEMYCARLTVYVLPDLSLVYCFWAWRHFWAPHYLHSRHFYTFIWNYKVAHCFSLSHSWFCLLRKKSSLKHCVCGWLLMTL